MRSPTLSALAWAAVLPLTCCLGQAQTAPPLRIHVSQPEEPLVRYAAEELQRYTRRLFGFHPPVDYGNKTSKAESVILLGKPLEEPVGSQEYVIRPVQHEGVAGLLVGGGSPRATMWAAYEVISAWGVRFLVQGDVFPEDPGPFRLPELNVKRTPVFPRREFRILNEMANSTVFWSLDQHKTLFDQLAKLRFTGVFAAVYQHNPFAHYSFRGLQRTKADLCYGFKHRIHAETIGRELFGGMTIFTNPDFQDAETYEERLVRGHRFLSGLIEAAHARGLEFTFSQEVGDLPEEFSEMLSEWSAGVTLPQEAASPKVTYTRLGLQVMGGDPEVQQYKSPLNPVYVDLVETILTTHIRAYPNADRYALWETEFPPGAAGAEKCWRQLDKKYKLEPKFSFQKITDTASRQFFYGEGRALRQALGAIQTLRMLDILVNERNILRHCSNPKAKIVVSFFSEHVQPVVAHVLPADKVDFQAVVDYLPVRVAERMHTLEFAKDSNMDVIMTVTIEDDNVGFLPQLTTPSLHRIVQRMREYSIKGFMFRQFDISQHEPAMAYMLESAWDATVTPEESYRRYARQVTGEAATEDLMAALRGVEELTETSNALMGVGFMMPNLYSRNWVEGIKPNPAFREYTRRLGPIEQRLEAAFANSAPRGRKFVENYMNFIRFAGQFLKTVDRIRQARLAYDQAQTSKKSKDPRAYHQHVSHASDLLFQAVADSEAAIKTWRRLLADPTDLGSLAGLNCYGHDWLRALAHTVYWESQFFGFSF